MSTPTKGNSDDNYIPLSFFMNNQNNQNLDNKYIHDLNEQNNKNFSENNNLMNIDESKNSNNKKNYGFYYYIVIFVLLLIFDLLIFSVSNGKGFIFYFIDYIFMILIIIFCFLINKYKNPIFLIVGILLNNLDIVLGTSLRFLVYFLNGGEKNKWLIFLTFVTIKDILMFIGNFLMKIKNN